MKKVQAILLSLMLTMAAIGVVYGAAGDGYIEGDINDNPWADLFTTQAPEVTTSVEETTSVIETTTEPETTVEEITTEEITTEPETTTEEVTTPEPETTTEEVTTSEPQELAILTQPQSVTAASGENIVLSVKAIGSGLKYSWEMSKDSGTTWVKSSIDGFNTAKISFAASELVHGRQYRCVVTDDFGNSIISDVAVIVVKELESNLMIISHPKSLSVEIGSRAQMTVGVVGQGLTYQWEMSNDGGITWTKSTIDGYNTSKISFSTIASLHGRQYRCVVTDENGNTAVSNPGVIILKELEGKLMITAHPKSVNVGTGDWAQMSVGAMGEGLTYRWEMSNDGGITWTKSTIDGYNTSKISFSTITSLHGRQYRCVVTDKNGDTAVSNPGVIILKDLEGELMITAHPKSVTIASGTKSYMSVGAMGQGLTYKWEMSKDGGATWVKSTIDGYNTSKISFTVTEALHGRAYRCVITDALGNSLISNGGIIAIKELENELMITTQPKQVIVNIGERAQMSVGAMGQGLSYRWEMSKDAGLTWTKSTIDGYNTSKISFNAIKDMHGRLYRCVVTDENGNTVTSNGRAVVINELSDQLMIVEQPTSVTVSEGESTQISVGVVGKGLIYQWEMSKDGGNTWTKSTIDGYNTSTISFNALSALDGRYYRCVITDSEGNSVTSLGAVIKIKK